MKLMYGNVPVKSLNIHTFERDTNDCDMVASDLQAGKTAVARGQKITGTGKAFKFAIYGGITTNVPWPVPEIINVIEIASIEYPVRLNFALNSMDSIDFSTAKTIGNIIIDNVEYPVTASVSNNLLTITCDKTITLQVFFGKDEYR